jgi:hypothetical protein
MSKFTYSRLAVMTIGISISNSLSITPVVAAETMAIVDRSARSGLDIGLQPIISRRAKRVGQHRAINQGVKNSPVTIANRSAQSGLDIGLEPIVTLKSTHKSDCHSHQ